MFDWENAIALDTVQGNRASSCREGKVSLVFSTCGRNLGYILELRRGCPFETAVCSLKSGHLCRYDVHLLKLNLAWQDNSDSSAVEMRDQASFCSFPSDIGIPIYIKKIVRHRQNLKQWTPRGFLVVKGMLGPFLR